MNRVGVHAQVWVGGWSEVECRKAIENSRAAGYDLIEIPVLDPSTIDVSTTRKALELIAEVGADNLNVHLDTYHMNRDV
jgi:D-psicose/D-tagatose/L-ribulose 3-epimerase